MPQIKIELRLTSYLTKNNYLCTLKNSLLMDEEEEFIGGEENIQDKLQSFLGKIPENFSVLEEEIDIDTQMEYFKFAKKLSRENDTDIIEKADLLYDESVSLDEKKEILVQLAGIDEPKAFRIIEKYKEDQQGKELFEWTAMAFQESRMLIQGSLLEENQVFISTGMGGKGQKLRYFVVLISENDEGFTQAQAKLLKSEVEYSFANSDSEIEEFNIAGKFVTLTALIPLVSNIKQLFATAIEECNQLGNFVKENFIVTNVKKLSVEEIEEFLNNTDEDDEINISIE